MIVALPGLFSYLFRKPLTSRLELDDLSGLARRGLNIVFYLHWHTVMLAISTRLCLS